jgi:hypothetical protein
MTPSMVCAEPLEQLFTELIASRLGITPGEVTLEYIQAQREARFYPESRYAVGTDYGGYNSHGLDVLSREEIARIECDVDAKLAAL